ncbi:DUF1127 domain-containing protein [Zestomonas carbonaria]|uniref:YjiS-like domain-containing protein n=1 Tax=Zestomonas carbonaria TaxID=2762745 RepID=A0A7U7EMW4_9GAMM|nr:DUF1127 domain-containing protein [Pseudomonas carbonaria]CAD5107392.1 hypothetical protein PSEWESI4_01664 [Pseudomonas carbonaria]
MERTLSSDLHFVEQSSAQHTHLPVRLFANFMLWQRRMNTRRELARLDPRLLADAGISEAQRYNELSKPFWR